MVEIQQICVYLGILSIIKLTDAGLCYSCASTKEDDPCVVNWKALRKSRLDTEAENVLQPYVKNCTGTRKYCSIERVENQGSLKSYIRDCSDGSFSAIYPSIDYLVPDNQTECGYQSFNLICLTLCSGDFCNGPSVASGLTPNVLVLLLLHGFVYIKYRLHDN